MDRTAAFEAPQVGQFGSDQGPVIAAMPAMLLIGCSMR